MGFENIYCLILKVDGSSGKNDFQLELMTLESINHRILSTNLFPLVALLGSKQEI